jgi:hypothetical protein
MTSPAPATDTLRPELEAGLRALALDVSFATPLLDYLALLVRWNATYNLTAIRDPREMVGKHLLDSLAMHAHVEGIGTLADLGTGPGLPGIPLEITKPGLRVTLVESNGKKVRFLREAVRKLGLATHRASTLVRVCRSLDLEGLRDRPIEAVEARLLRERGLGPWSLGVIALEGLGSFRHGLVGDLGLVKLCAALWGRWVEIYETAELLAPYEEWAGLAGFYLMRGSAAGLVPGASSDRARLARCRAA